MVDACLNNPIIRLAQLAVVVMTNGVRLGATEHDPATKRETGVGRFAQTPWTQWYASRDNCIAATIIAIRVSRRRPSGHRCAARSVHEKPYAGFYSTARVGGEVVNSGAITKDQGREHLIE